MYYKAKCLFVKRAVSMLLAGGMLCGVAGCDSSETSSADSGSISSTLTASDNADLSNPQSEFDFNEAVKNITLFGHKISLPSTIKEFGDDFNINTEPFEKALSSGENRVACNLLYKGMKIGTVAIADCTPEDNYNNKKIDTIMLGFSVDYSNWSEEYKNNYFKSSGWYNDLIDAEIGGITFKSSEEQVRSKLGNPTIERPYFENGNEIVYTFFQDEEKHLVKSIVFRFQKNVLVGMNINFVEA